MYTIAVVILVIETIRLMIELAVLVVLAVQSLKKDINELMDE